MNTQWFQQPWLQTLGWTLVHSLWQLSLLAALALLLLLTLRQKSAQLRYALSYTLLLAMMLLPLATYAYLWSHIPHPIITSPEPSTFSSEPLFASAPLPTFIASPSIPPTLWQSTKTCLQSVPPYAALAYLLGAALLTLRLLAGYTTLRQIRTTASPAPTHEPLLAHLRARLRIATPVRLLHSARVEVPTVIGAFRPIILLPLTTLTGLSPDHVSCLLLHELAHIRRHDYLANLLQSLIETLLFYHPAVLWLSTHIRQEREHCCDDLALAAAGNRAHYAAALASMESLRADPSHTPPNLALAARGGSLLHRIRRILQVPTPRPITQRILSGASLTAAASAVLLFALYLAACSRHDAPPATSQAATAAPADPESIILATQPATESLNRPAQIGDVLQITIYELIASGKRYTDHFPVDENGNIHLLAIGTLPAAGRTPRQLEDTIAKAATQILRNPEIRVDFTDEYADLRPLQNGERLSFKIFELETPNDFLTDTAVIDENGDLPIWHVGRIHVTGLTPTQAAAKIAATTVEKSILRNPAYVAVSRATPTVTHNVTSATPGTATTNSQAFTRAYDIRNLLLQLTTRITGLNDDVTPNQKKISSPEAVRAEAVQSIMNAIKNVVAPATWRENGGTVGSMTEFQGELIITQTNENQAEVETVIGQLRQGADLQISTEMRVEFVDDDTYASLNLPIATPSQTSNVLSPTGQVQPQPTPAPVLVNDSQLSTWIQKIEANPTSTQISTPRITLFNGQTGFIEAVQPWTYISEVTKRSDENGSVATTLTTKTLKSGVSVHLKALVSSDRRSIIMNFAPLIRRLQKLENIPAVQGISTTGAAVSGVLLQVPTVQETKLSTTLTIPDAMTAVFYGWTMKPNLSPSTEDEDKIKAMHLIIFVRPKIILEKDIEKTLYGSAATQPLMAR